MTAIWDRVRSEIPGLHDSLYFNTGTMGPSPEPVTAAFVAAYQAWQAAGPGRVDVYEHLRDSAGPRQAVATFLGVRPEQLAFVENATDAINAVAYGLSWQPGDRVIVSDHEHPANLAVWLLLQQTVGIVVDQIALPPTADALLARLAAALRPETRLVSLPHISPATGQILPAQAIADLVHDQGVLLLVDGAQALGQVPLHLGALGADFYTFNGHKWLCGPGALGGLVLGDEALEILRPSLVGAGNWTGRLNACDPVLPPFLPTARRFETGTRNWPLHAGLVRAIDYWSEVGLDSMFARSRQLADHLRSELALVPGVTLVQAELPAERSGIVSFTLDGCPGNVLHERLWAEQRIATRAVWELASLPVRISVACYNTPEEIARFVHVVRGLAQ